MSETKREPGYYWVKVCARSYHPIEPKWVIREWIVPHGDHSEACWMDGEEVLYYENSIVEVNERRILAPDEGLLAGIMGSPTGGTMTGKKMADMLWANVDPLKFPIRNPMAERVEVKRTVDRVFYVDEVKVVPASLQVERVSEEFLEELAECNAQQQYEKERFVKAFSEMVNQGILYWSRSLDVESTDIINMGICNSINGPINLYTVRTNAGKGI
ncbi:MAG: hypothetical protein KF744_09115 [Taibaiella sp.]|nr:hypothetical protein [Taibaiella sp.]